MELLNTGMQHIIEKPMEHYWNDLIIETEQAIKKLERTTLNLPTPSIYSGIDTNMAASTIP